MNGGSSKLKRKKDVTYLKTAAKIISIVSLITFIIGIVFAIVSIVMGIAMGNMAEGAWNPNDIGADALLGLLGFFGGGFLWLAGIISGIICLIYDVVAHAPALIAHIVWKKTQNVTIYWLLISVWLCLLLGTSFFILIF